jgi:hypothetical protein
MKLTTKAAIFASIFLLSATLALAGHHYHGKGYGHGYGMHSGWEMSDRDTNQDGKLSFDEFSGPQVEMLRAGFEMIDTNKDGQISAEEWGTFLKVHGVQPKS